jgi:DNA-directed RNA polymerase specialized sigma24 family protein
MVQKLNLPNDSLILFQPNPDGAEAFQGLEEIFERIAAGLYSLAVMLVGEGEESVQLVENAISTAKVSPCADPHEAQKSCRQALSTAALDLLVQRDSTSLAAPEWLVPASSCIEGDDLASAGISTEELVEMIGGKDRDRVRQWLASLSSWMRTVFVLRAVAGFSAMETAAMLKKHGGQEAGAWTADAVREVFRQGLCSLASQLLHASAEQAT